jgi:hypothetical protein
MPSEDLIHKTHHHQLEHKYSHVFCRYTYLYIPTLDVWRIHPYTPEDYLEIERESRARASE